MIGVMQTAGGAVGKASSTIFVAFLAWGLFSGI